MKLQKPGARHFVFLQPFLLAIYSPLSLWLANIDQVQATILAWPLLFSLGAAAAALLAGFLIFRSSPKAGFFASFVVVLFFSYGHVFQVVDEKAVGGFVFGRHRYLLPLWGALLPAGLVFLWKTRWNARAAGQVVGTVSVFLVGMVLLQAAYLRAAHGLQARAPGQGEAPRVAAASTAGEVSEKPDVYYIILDAYARQDVLAETHGLDIGGFIEQLTGLGFYVAGCSQSNYVWTPLSLGSSLNMNYVEALQLPIEPEAERMNYWDFSSLLGRSLARQRFEAMGYQTVTFKTVYDWLDVPDSTHYINFEKTTSFFDQQSSLNFQYLFLRTTAVRPLLEAQEKNPAVFDRLPPFLLQVVNPKAGLFTNRRARQYEQNLFALESLSKLPEIPGPKFVYAHLFTTHQPYVFNPDGSMRWQEVENMSAYNDQVVYTNQRMLEILQKIINDSKVPPIIVIQGDHGYLDDEQRVKILNAYYLPGVEPEKLYPTISPVNTFRLIFNEYFNGNDPLLPDQSFYSARGRPYQFEQIPASCASHP